MRGLLLSCVAALLVWAAPPAASENVEITAKHFESDEVQRISVFTDDVVITKGLDRMNAARAVVYLDAAKKADRFEFFGTPVTFIIKMDENQTYRGKAGRIEYFPKTKEYHLYEAAYVEQVEEQRKIFGSEIYIDQQNRRSRVVGTKDVPARFVFPADEKKK